MKIAIIGGGISGLVAARTLLRFGHQAVIFERSSALGGVWTTAYPEIRLQNVAEQYRASDFPWPFPPEFHPTGEQILRYLQAFVDRFGLSVRLKHEVASLEEEPDAWQLTYRNSQQTASERFDFVVVATGHYSAAPKPPTLTDRERFAGQVLTEREVHDLSIFDGKQVVVVGFGKSAIDMATLAAERGATVHHVFRAPRWLIPGHILGIHYTKLLFARMTTALIPAWVQPTAAERFLHTRLQPLVSSFWAMIQAIVRLEFGMHGLVRDPQARQRLRLLQPEQPLPYEMRSAIAKAPDNYFPFVAQGRIKPYRGEVAGFAAHALRLADGREIPCNLVVLSTGFPTPCFPFLPSRYRELVEQEPDGVQLYRHLLHPRIPRLAFAGFNHGFLHVPAVEASMLWLCAYLRGDLVLPPVAEMEHCIEEIRRWKRDHILFEPSRNCGVNTRFHQYLDVLLADLGLPAYRKSNLLYELLSSYSAGDYDGLYEEYERARTTLQLPRRPLPLTT